MNRSENLGNRRLSTLALATMIAGAGCDAQNLEVNRNTQDVGLIQDATRTTSQAVVEEQIIDNCEVNLVDVYGPVPVVNSYFTLVNGGLVGGGGRFAAGEIVSGTEPFTFITTDSEVVLISTSPNGGEDFISFSNGSIATIDAEYNLYFRPAGSTADDYRLIGPSGFTSTAMTGNGNTGLMMDVYGNAININIETGAIVTPIRDLVPSTSAWVNFIIEEGDKSVLVVSSTGGDRMTIMVDTNGDGIYNDGRLYPNSTLVEVGENMRYVEAIYGARLVSHNDVAANFITENVFSGLGLYPAHRDSYPNFAYFSSGDTYAIFDTIAEGVAVDTVVRGAESVLFVGITCTTTPVVEPGVDAGPDAVEDTADTGTDIVEEVTDTSDAGSELDVPVETDITPDTLEDTADTGTDVVEEVIEDTSDAETDVTPDVPVETDITPDTLEDTLDTGTDVVEEVIEDTSDAETDVTPDVPVETDATPDTLEDTLDTGPDTEVRPDIEDDSSDAPNTDVINGDVQDTNNVDAGVQDTGGGRSNRPDPGCSTAPATPVGFFGTFLVVAGSIASRFRRRK